MLDSKAVASVKTAQNGIVTLFIRTHYIEDLGIWAFRACLKTFKTEAEALTYYKKTHPQGVIVDFTELTTYAYS